MSTTAIRDVTQALQVLLLAAVKGVSGTAQVSLLPPGDKLPGGLGVNLYLFRIMESAFTRNADWPGDRQTSRVNTPAMNLELSYLLTPFAPAPDASTSGGDDAHTLMGAAMLTLFENPILNDVHIPGFDADSVLPPAIRNSYERVKITLAATSIEELSKIWATINQPYRLSVAYHVSLVQLTPSAAPGPDPAQVLSTGVNVIAWDAPRLERLNPVTGSLAKVDAGGNLVPNSVVIAGAGLSLLGHTPTVMVGGRSAAVSMAPAPTASALTAVLPTSLDGGPAASVVVSVASRSSAPLSFQILPFISGILPIRSTLESPSLVLSGSGFTSAPQGVRFESAGGVVNVTTFVSASDTSATVNIPSTLSNGAYTLRLVIPSGDASNGATLEVIPAVGQPIGVAKTGAGASQVHVLTINGARLSGSDIRVMVDGVTYALGKNADAGKIVLTLARLLDPGPHTVAVSVDGSVSHAVDVVI